MDGQRVPVDEPFELEGADGDMHDPMYPRDERLPAGERINCHCIAQPIVSEDVLGLSIEERRELQARAIAEDDGEWEKDLDRENRAKAGVEETLYKPDESRYNEVYQDIQSNYNLGVNQIHQDRHVLESGGYIEGRSVLTADAGELLKLYQGKSELKFAESGNWTNKEFFTHTEVIGTWKSKDGTQSAETKNGSIHYAKRNGVHIVPRRP